MFLLVLNDKSLLFLLVEREQPKFGQLGLFQGSSPSLNLKMDQPVFSLWTLKTLPNPEMQPN
jgi:hypothetical protein